MIYIAETFLIGRKVADVKYYSYDDLMYDDDTGEIEDPVYHNKYQHGDVTVLIFDDGTIVDVMQDDEGNGPGALRIYPPQK
jgi:hypothetical protein